MASLAPKVSPVTKPTPVSPAATGSPGISPPMKKSRFHRRKRTGSTIPTYSRSHSSMSMDSSTHSAASGTAAGGKQKRKSLLHRLLRTRSSSPATKSLVIETKTSKAEQRSDTEAVHLDASESSTQAHIEIVLLEQQGLKDRQAGKLTQAAATWTEALNLAEAHDTHLTNQLLCRLISLYLQIYHSSKDKKLLEKAASLVSQLEPLDSHDNSHSCLEGSPLLLDLLMEHSCWSWALQVSHNMPDTKSLTLARLRLEVALECDNNKPQQLSHLAECHQLLLSHEASNRDMDCYQELWQALAQAYGTLGEDELALGCSQSRMQCMSSPAQIALAHYDQALNVYSPVGQYGLALKEAELALAVLKESSSNMSISSTKEQNEEQGDEEDESELLLMKLYQFKADVLCRMGRIGDSIQSYEKLLQAYLESSSHGPVEAANVLYILGKLSVRAKQFRKAIDYFDQELQMTKSIVGRGQHHMAVSKILHELAKVADAGMMDYPLAIRYYQEALKVESGVYKQCQQQQKQKGATLQTSTLLQDAKYQMGETKQCLGKLHFKMGDFATAMHTTLAVDK